MGCIFSVIKTKTKKEDNLMNNLLLSTNNDYCYLCKKTFKNTKKYNKHIIKCNENYRNNQSLFIY